MTKRNGLTLRNISIAIGILLALGGILWGFAVKSGDVDRVIKDAGVLDGRVDTVEDAIIVMQGDLKYIKTDMIKQETLATSRFTEQKALTEEILKVLTK